MLYIVRVKEEPTSYLTSDATLSTDIKKAHWFISREMAWEAINNYKGILPFKMVEVVEIPLKENKMNFYEYGTRLASVIAAEAILNQEENDFVITEKDVIRIMKRKWRAETLPPITNELAEYVCKVLYSHFECGSAIWEENNRYWAVIMYTDYTLMATTGEEEY